MSNKGTTWHGRTVQERFELKVNVNEQTGCWDWTAKINNGGYGEFQYKGKSEKAHRVSLIIYKGLEPNDGLYVCHTCDNRKCVNPDHLFLGTAQDNMDDMYDKGRRIRFNDIPCPSRAKYLKNICRCPLCTKAANDYQQEWERKKIEEDPNRLEQKRERWRRSNKRRADKEKLKKSA